MQDLLPDVAAAVDSSYLSHLRKIGVDSLLILQRTSRSSLPAMAVTTTKEGSQEHPLL